MLETIYSQKELECFLKKENKISNYIKFTDSFGDINYINTIKKGDKTYYSLCEGYLSYNESKSLNAEEISRLKNIDFLIEPFNDGVLYEIDTYPIQNTDILYPIMNVELLSEKELLMEMVDVENNSVLNMILKEA